MLSCPRCGYDLRGVVHTWTECCPLRGRCSECALEYEWWRIFSPPMQGRLFDIIHLWPIVLLAVGLSVAALLALQMQLALFAIEMGFRATGTMTVFGPPPSVAFALSRSLVVLGDPQYSTVYRLGALLVWPVGFPLLFVLVPVTLSRVQVQARHIVRIAAYSWLPPLAALLLWQGGLLIFDLMTLDLVSGMGRGSEPQRVFWPGAWPVVVWWDPRIADTAQLLIFVVTAIWTALWWQIACGQYLRLKTSGRIVLAFSVIMALVTAIIVVFEYLAN